MTLTLATFNLLDWFGDDENLLARRVDAVAPLLRRLAADVVGFQEVASDAALERLLDAGGLSGAAMVHGSRDARGIGCSLASRLPVLRSEIVVCPALPFPVFVEGDPPPFTDRIPLRRGFISAVVDAGSFGTVQVFVAHLKSKRGVPRKATHGDPVRGMNQGDFAEEEIRAVVWRVAEALRLRRAVDAAVARAEADHVVVMGDLNDVAGSLALSVLMGRGEGALASVGETIEPAARFSILHHGRPVAIDHLLVSAALFTRLSAAAFMCDALVDMSRLGAGDPRPPGSDHAPLFARFRSAVLV